MPTSLFISMLIHIPIIITPPHHFHLHPISPPSFTKHILSLFMALQERAPTMDLKTPQELKIGTDGSKKRKVVQSTVVRVRVGEDGGRQKGEVPPSDSWSWRKYGQKPIKGSPYPRGYYRCSTSKGCSAKKQVEKCRTDSSVLIITYTASHNHPDPESIQCPSAPHTSTITQQPTIQTTQATTLQKPLTEETERAQEQPDICDEEEPPIVSSPVLNTCKKDDDGFFDELEELPISPSWTGFVRSGFFDEKGSSPIIDCAL